MPSNQNFRCWVPHCPNARKRTRIPNSHFHSFPVRNPERCRRWLQTVGYEDLVYLPMHTLQMRYVCSEHFTEADYCKSGSSNPNLKFSAVPSKFPPGYMPLNDEIMTEWPPKLASDKNKSPKVENLNLTRENRLGQEMESAESSLENTNDKILASAVSAGILQPDISESVVHPKITRAQMAAAESETEEPPNDRGLPSVTQELLMQHLKLNAGQGLKDGDMLLGFVVQRGSDLHVVPVGPGHATMVAPCIEELLSSSGTVSSSN